MEQRECDVQLINKEFEHRHKKPILMNVPTRCRRPEQFVQGHKRHNVSAKNKGTTCAHKGIDGNAQTDVVFFHLFLCLLPRAFAQGCKSQTTHYLCCTSSNHEGCLAAIDRNRRRLVDLPREFPKLVQRQDGPRSLLLHIQWLASYPLATTLHKPNSIRI